MGSANCYTDWTYRKRGTNTPPRRTARLPSATLQWRVPIATHSEQRETRNAAQDYGKEDDSDPTATPAPPQAAREQKRAAPLKKMSGLIPHIKTTPYDKRFPSTNQASHCWNRYNEYVMCLKKTESDEDACKPMRQLALSICPDDWWGKWDEEREEGTFSGVKMTDAAATAGH